MNYNELILHYARKVLNDTEWNNLLNNADKVMLYGEHGLRRYVSERSFEAFLYCYFYDEFTVVLADIHYQMLSDLEEIKLRAINKEKGVRYARIIPRGHSKTTYYARILPLHAMLFGYSPLTVLLGNTQSAASRLVRNIKTTIESNQEILRDFPNIRSAQWNTEIITATNGCSIVGYGSDSGAIRGVSNALSRPTLVIGDDLDDDNSVRSEVMTNAMIDWYDRAVMQMGDNVAFTTSFIVTGTLISKNSLLQHIIDSKDFHSIIKRGIIHFAQNTQQWDEWQEIYKSLAREGKQPTKVSEDEYYQYNKELLLAGTEVLWERPNSYYEMMVYRLARGEKAFNSEIQNQISNEIGSFLAPVFTTVDNEAEYDLLFSFDSAIKGKDYNAASEVLFHPIKKDVIVRWNYTRKCSYADAINELSQRILSSPRNYSGIFVEANSAGDIVCDLFESKIKKPPYMYNVWRINNRIPKLERIGLVDEYMRKGQIKFINNSTHEELFNEMSFFPNMKNDDALDALAICILYLHEKNLIQLIKPIGRK